MRLASFTVSALVLGLSVPIVFACGSGSSSSPSSGKLGGSAKRSTCKNKTLNQSSTASDEVCDACDAEKCAVEGAAALGADPNAFGGVCGEYLACACDCDMADAACLAKCPVASQACKDAVAATQTCERSKCATECAKDGG